MSRKIEKPNQKMQAWIDARRRRHLSHSQIQMARELGLYPAKLGKIDNHKQEPWKLPLSQFIEQLYFARLGGSTNSTDRTGDAGPHWTRGIGRLTLTQPTVA